MVVKTTPIERCHRCLKIKKAYTYAVVERYGKKIIDYYCEECTKTADLKLRIGLTITEAKVERVSKSIVKQLNDKEDEIEESEKEELVFLRPEDFETLRITPREMVLAVLDGNLISRELINRKLTKAWGGRLRPKTLTDTLRELVRKGEIQCFGTNSHDTLSRRTGMNSSPESERVEAVNLIENRRRGFLSVAKLKANGIVVDALVLNLLGIAPKTKEVIGIEMRKKHGGRLTDQVLKRVLKTLVGVGCVQKTPSPSGKESKASYRLLVNNPTPTQNVQNNPSRLQPFLDYAPKGPACSRNLQQPQRVHS